MTFRLRAARADDLEHLYEMAKLTGGGFTNLPPDRNALGTKLARASEAFARDEDELADEQFVLILEDTATGAIRGTCQLMNANLSIGGNIGITMGQKGVNGRNAGMAGFQQYSWYL